MWPADKRLRSIPSLAVAIALFAGCGGGDDGPAAPTPSPENIFITTSGAPPPLFIPASITMTAGGKVSWTNGSPAAHNLHATTPNWQLNRDLPIGGRVTNILLDTPGTYRYECTIHPSMTGTIVVVE